MASKVEIDIIAHDKTSGAISSITGTMAKLSTVLLGVATAGAAAFLALGKQALDATAEYERLTLTMETLVARELKAADSTLNMADALGQATPRAQELLGWIQKLAIQSPFDMEGVAVAFRTALAYGFTSEQAQRLTQNMIDFAAGTGQSVAVMNQAALALGQVRAKGKLAGQEILQLVNAGVPVNDILKEMGFTLDDVSKGLVSADAFLEAFSMTMEEDFAGAAKRSTNSWAGLMNSLGDIKKIGLRTLFADTFAVLQPMVASLAEWLQGDGLKQLEAWGKGMGNLTQSVVDLFSSMQGKDLSELFVDLTASFKSWAEAIDWDKLSNELADGINSIDWALLGERVNEGFSNIFAGVGDIVSEVDWSALGISLGLGLDEFLAGLTGQGSVDNVVNTWINNIMAAFEINLRLMEIGQRKAAEFTTGITNALLGGISPIVGVLLSWEGPIMGALELIKKAFFNAFLGAAQQAIQALRSMQNSVINAVIAFLNAIKNVIKPIMISIGVSLPNFAALADKLAAGMALLAGAGSKSKGAQVSGTLNANGGWGSNKPLQGGYADGGISTGSTRGHMELLHGTEAVIPLKGGNIPVQLQGNSGGNVTVNLTYAPMFSTADKYEMQEKLLPFIEQGIRNLRGATA